jgi:hypothetical protein
MRQFSLAVLIIVGLSGVVACGDSAVITTTAPDQPAPTDTDSSPADGIAELEAEIEDFASRVADSDAADEVRDAWNALAAELMTVVESAEEGTAETRERLRAELDEFGEALSELQVEDEIRSSWDELRTRVEEEMG